MAQFYDDFKCKLSIIISTILGILHDKNIVLLHMDGTSLGLLSSHLILHGVGKLKMPKMSLWRHNGQIL